MEIISNPTKIEIKKAAQALKDGNLVAFPTETVYGLGADATNEKAVSRVYSVKGRPTDHPLIVHISSINQLDKWAVAIPEYAIKLANKFWPGPMTLVLERTDLAKDFVTGGQANVGVRVPAHPVAHALLSEFEKLGGLGIAAPSANKFGLVSPTTSTAVYEELNQNLDEKDLILDGGQSNIGIESTIIDCTSINPVILRPGAITFELIKMYTENDVFTNNPDLKIRASGSLDKHYSPKALVVLDEIAVPGDGLIALANIPTPKGVIRLSAPESVEDFAKDLYIAFRLGDYKKINKIVVLKPKGSGLSVAIIDRLSKAANTAKITKK
jgi:L-threonylcarbamoyladenylate synthase